MSNGFDANAWANLMQKHYDTVYQKSMQSIPVCNPDIAIEFPVLHPIAPGAYLGVMITPWFVNAVFKRVDEQGRDVHKTHFKAKVSDTITLSFPSGRYEFIVNYQPGVGYFYTCALMSDMHVFESHKVAVEFALTCFKLMFDREAKEQTNQQHAIKKIQMGQAKVVKGEDGQVQVVDRPAPKASSTESLQKRLEAPVSRRGLLGLKALETMASEDRQ